MERNINKSRSVYIRLQPGIAARLDAAASEAELSRAGWVRREIVRALPEGSEAISLPPSPPRRPTTIPADELVEVSRLSAAISRTGGAVVQLCRALREGCHPFHDDAERVLADLRAVQGDIGRLVARLAG